MKSFFENNYNVRLVLSNMIFFVVGIMIFIVSSNINNSVLSGILTSVGSILIVSGLYNIINEYIIPMW